MKEKILITGISGSGGSYLADYIVEHQPDIEVHGISRWHSTTSRNNLSAIRDRVQVHECDLNDLSSILRVLEDVQPQGIFNIASHANVRASFDTPLSVLQNNIFSTANLLEAIRLLKLKTRVVHCSTSEVYGQVNSDDVPIKESCAINPSSPYAVSKVTQDFLGYTYFLNYGVDVVRTRMFSYLNPRRDDLFATAFALQVARIEAGQQEVLRHGNLDSVRTLIDVRDAMETYWLSYREGQSGEIYNLGGTKTIRVGEFLDLLKKQARTDIPSQVDPALLRPTDVTLQVPDTSKFESLTGWKPKYSFEESVGFLLDQCRRRTLGGIR